MMQPQPLDTAPRRTALHSTAHCLSVCLALHAVLWRHRDDVELHPVSTTLSNSLHAGGETVCEYDDDAPCTTTAGAPISRRPIIGLGTEGQVPVRRRLQHLQHLQKKAALH